MIKLISLEKLIQEIFPHFVESFNELPEREKEILILKFGLDGHPPRNLEEIGKLLRLTRERIRGLIDEALGKMRQPTD